MKTAKNSIGRPSGSPPVMPSTNMKEMLKEVDWLDQEWDEDYTLRFQYDPAYSSEFRSIFGCCPVYYYTIYDKVLYEDGAKKIIKFLKENGFQCFEATETSFKYIDKENNIIISGSYNIPLEITTLSEDDVAGTDEIGVTFYPHCKNKSVLQKFANLLEKVLKSRALRENKFFMVAQNDRGLFNLETKFSAIPIKDDRYDLFYGETFPHETLKKFITDETDNLMLLHGDPGTGKSNYIKNIVLGSAKNILYVPPSMLSVIASPSFITYISANRDSILLIEDAEEILSTDRNAATNNLLGMTSGFLKDALNLKVICTFNCEIGKIDDAILRKGRLYFEYRFKSLSPTEANNLSEFMGLNERFTKNVTLADIFNPQSNNSNGLQKKAIGFNSF